MKYHSSFKKLTRAAAAYRKRAQEWLAKNNNKYNVLAEYDRCSLSARKPENYG